MSKQTNVKAGKPHEVKKNSMWAETWRRLRKNWSAMLGLVIVILLVLTAVCADFLYDYEDVVIAQDITNRRQSPSREHPFGTDTLGRDILSRIVHGSRVSLLIGFAAVAFSLLVGGFLGAIAGFYSGRIDNFIMRIMDVFLAIPGTLLAICIMAALGTSIFNLIIALSISNVPVFARIVRGSVLTVRDVEYVEAARAIGCNNAAIIFRHVIPNSMAPVIVQTTLNVATVILTIAGLSFLGLGVSAPRPEWGAMLSEARSEIREYSFMTMFPGLAIMITILALNLLGDGLRDALDPRLR